MSVASYEKVGTVTVTRQFDIPMQLVDDILSTAFEGGINYWCDEVKVDSYPEGAEFASDCVSRGGVIEIHDFDSGWHTLDLKKFIDGLSEYLNNEDFGVHNAEVLLDDYDAGDADIIVQLALFGEVMYG
jgi:hypothetical protein